MYGTFHKNDFYFPFRLTQEDNTKENITYFYGYIPLYSGKTIKRKGGILFNEKNINHVTC